MGPGSPEPCAPANLPRRLVIDCLGAVWDRELDRTGFVVAADAEQRGLLGGVLAHLTHFFRLVHHATFRFFLLPLSLALVLVPLFLLARLFFLTLGKS